MSKAAKICAIYVNTATSGSASWLRIKKSTALTITQNPETEDFDYIADENPTTEVKTYKPVIDQDIAVLPSEPDYTWFYEDYMKHPTGEDAHKEFLLVYLSDKKSGGAYTAVKQEAVLTYTSFDAVAGTLNYSIAFCGTEQKGTATIAAGGVPTFTPASSGGSSST